MVDAILTPRELRERRRASGLALDEFAARLNVTEDELSWMEHGKLPIPARFDDAVDSIVEYNEGEPLE